MVDPPHQLDLIECLWALDASYGEDPADFQTLLSELEADVGRRDRVIARESAAELAAERLRTRSSLR